MRVVVTSESPPVYDTKGRLVQPKTRRVYAQFQRSGLPPWAISVARDRFEARKKPPDIPFENWVAFYDSEADQILNGWTDEERALIEERVGQSAYAVQVEAPKLPVPVPAYDKIRVHGQRKIEHVVEAILALVETTGIPAQTFLDYERQEANRPEVVKALEGLLNVEEPVEELISA